jgi:hypothetical protein
MARRKTFLVSTPRASGAFGTRACGVGHGADVAYSDFLLKPELLRAISDLGFEHPSEG